MCIYLYMNIEKILKYIYAYKNIYIIYNMMKEYFVYAYTYQYLYLSIYVYIYN